MTDNVRLDPLADVFAAPTFTVEPFTLDLVDELLPLFVAHYREIATYQDIALKPRWDKYAILEAKKLLRVYVARVDGKACGYSVWILDKHLHYEDMLQAQNDVLYLEPKLRGRLQGMKFIKWSIERLREDGCLTAFLHIKKAHDWSKMAERLGFQEEEKILRMRLD